jgi:hypothetical protein
MVATVPPKMVSGMIRPLQTLQRSTVDAACLSRRAIMIDMKTSNLQFTAVGQSVDSKALCDRDGYIKNFLENCLSCSGEYIFLHAGIDSIDSLRYELPYFIAANTKVKVSVFLMCLMS